MKINFSQEIKSIDGSKMEGAPILKDIAVMSLISSIEGDNAIQPQKKFEMGLLAQHIATSGDMVEVTAENVALLKDRIGRAYPPLVVLNAWQIFEGASSPAAACNSD